MRVKALTARLEFDDGRPAVTVKGPQPMILDEAKAQNAARIVFPDGRQMVRRTLAPPPQMPMGRDWCGAMTIGLIQDFWLLDQRLVMECIEIIGELYRRADPPATSGMTCPQMQQVAAETMRQAAQRIVTPGEKRILVPTA